MKYSRNKINNAGKTLVNSNNELEIASSELLIDEWRKLHSVPLDNIYEQIYSLLSSNNIPIYTSSRRLKRMVSIKRELGLNPNMGLGGLQDIGGARFVIDNTESLNKAYQLLNKHSFSSFEFEKSYNYIDNPKDSGYRGYHLVYKYHSSDESDGLNIELQIRTKLQHDWAMAVETAELISKSALKAIVGDKEWLAFFQLTSAIFAKKEKSVVNSRFIDYDEERFCKEYAKINASNNFLDQLRGLRTIVKVAPTVDFTGGYCLIVIDFDNKRVQYKCFKTDEYEEANSLYVKLESSQTMEVGKATVLVSVNDIENLRKSYPSYFLDTAEFIEALKSFTDICKVKKYI